MGEMTTQTGLVRPVPLGIVTAGEFAGLAVRLDLRSLIASVSD